MNIVLPIFFALAILCFALVLMNAQVKFNAMALGFIFLTLGFAVPAVVTLASHVTK